MPKLIWDQIGERFYETGVKQGVLYPMESSGIYSKGIVWNGLIAVTESPSGAEPTPIYADDIKYLNLLSAEEYGATIEAYTYPDEFTYCDGSAELATGVLVGQQPRKSFGLSYKTTLGNDTDGNDYGYKLHIIYGALASPSEKSYNTINDSPEAITFSWEVTTTPVSIDGFKPTASVVIDSTKVDAGALEALEDILYGTMDDDPYLPLPDEISAIFGGSAPSAIELSTILPDDDAANVAVNSDIVLTFNNKILRESVVVTKADGTIVSGTKSWDSTGKILTFDPTSNLDASSTYIVTVGGVVDIYGKSLVAQVKNFATAA